MEREQLLAGLHEAQSLMNQIVALQNKIIQISHGFQAEISYKKPAKKIVCCLICFFLLWIVPGRIVAAIIIFPFNMALHIEYDTQIILIKIINPIFSFIFGIILGLLIQKYLSKKTDKENALIDQKNYAIREYNMQLQLDIENTERNIYDVQKRYTELIAPWFPPDYCYLEAVQFFVNTVSNYRASSVQEMVNYMKTTNIKTE